MSEPIIVLPIYGILVLLVVEMFLDTVVNICTLPLDDASINLVLLQHVEIFYVHPVYV